MKSKETLGHLTWAELQKDTYLHSMQVDINNGCYEDAMWMQLEYLYWFDECVRLQEKFHDEWWDLRAIAHGCKF